MNNDILKQIENELVYAESKHPNQHLSKVEALRQAEIKLNSSYNYDSPCNLCPRCDDSKKFACNALAAIAILIRGIEESMKEKERDFFENRKAFFKKWFVDKKSS